MSITNDRTRKNADAARADALEMKVFEFDVKAMGVDEPGVAPSFSGHGAVFLNVDSVGDIIAPGAFTEDINEYVQTGFVGGLNHDWDCPIARPKAAYEDSKGLYVESGDIVDTAHGCDVAKLLRNGIIRKLSIGYNVLRKQMITSMEALNDFWASHDYTPSEEDIDRATQAIKVGHKEFDKFGNLVDVKGVRLLRRIKLFEVSPVTRPANMLADIMGVKSTLRDSLEAKVSWRDYSAEVAAAVGEFSERATRRVRNRVGLKVGRVLSQANYDSIASVAGAMESNAAQLRDVLAAAQVNRNEPASSDVPKSVPEPTAKSADPAATAETTAEVAPAPEAVTAAHDTTTEPGSSPAPDVTVVDAHVEPPANPADPVPDSTIGPDPAASPAAPAFDESEILAQYATTQHAITMATVGSLISNA